MNGAFLRVDKVFNSTTASITSEPCVDVTTTSQPSNSNTDNTTNAESSLSIAEKVQK